jgi:uncharacterized Tic20 family protein
MTEQVALPPEGSPDSRGWAVAAHLTPWIAGFLGPLIIWLAKKDDPFVEEHARESLNFQLSLMLYFFVLMMSLVLVVWIPFWLVVWIPAFFGLAILGLVTNIIGAIRASNGRMYRYPLCIRFVSRPRS